MSGQLMPKAVENMPNYGFLPSLSGGEWHGGCDFYADGKGLTASQLSCPLCSLSKRLEQVKGWQLGRLVAGQLLCTLCTIPKCLEQGEDWQLVSFCVHYVQYLNAWSRVKAGSWSAVVYTMYST